MELDPQVESMRQGRRSRVRESVALRVVLASFIRARVVLVVHRRREEAVLEDERRRSTVRDRYQRSDIRATRVLSKYFRHPVFDAQYVERPIVLGTNSVIRANTSVEQGAACVPQRELRVGLADVQNH